MFRRAARGSAANCVGASCATGRTPCYARASNLQLLIGRNAPVRIVQSWLLEGQRAALLRTALERAAPQAVRRARASNLQLLIGRNAPVRVVQSWLLIGRERACKLIFTGRFTGDVQEDKL